MEPGLPRRARACSCPSSRRSAGRSPSAAPAARAGRRSCAGRPPSASGSRLGVLVLLIATARWIGRRSSSTARSCCWSAWRSASPARWPATSPGAACRAPGTSRATAPTSAPTASSGCWAACCCAVIGVKTAGPFGIAVGIAGLLAVPVALRVRAPELDEGPEAALARGRQRPRLLLVASLLRLRAHEHRSGDREAAGVRRPGRGRRAVRQRRRRSPASRCSCSRRSRRRCCRSCRRWPTAGRLGDFRAGLKRLHGGRGRPGGRRHRRRRRAGAVRSSRSCSPTPTSTAARWGCWPPAAGLYMLALACAQAVIALGGHRDQAIGWGLGLVALAVITWRRQRRPVPPGRAGAAGRQRWSRSWPWACCCSAAWRSSGPLAVDRGDLIEAIHEVADRALTRSGHGVVAPWPPRAGGLRRLLSGSARLFRAAERDRPRGCPMPSFRELLAATKSEIREVDTADGRRAAPAARRRRARRARARRVRAGRHPRRGAHPPGHARELGREPDHRQVGAGDHPLRQRRALGLRGQDAQPSWATPTSSRWPAASTSGRTRAATGPRPAS